MADLSQHSNYTGAYSGLLDNLWVTLAVAGFCLVGYELEVHIPRRRGRDGTFRRIPVRVVWAVRGQWVRWRRRKSKSGSEGGGEGRPSTEGLIRGRDGGNEVDEARRRLGSREAWEFG
jgi:hypothetical protein